MIRFIAFIICCCIIASFCSCSHIDSKTGNNTSADLGLSVVTINGCQYVVYNGIEKCAMVHAGNCNNPIHGILHTNEISLVRDTITLK